MSGRLQLISYLVINSAGVQRGCDFFRLFVVVVFGCFCLFFLFFFVVVVCLFVFGFFFWCVCVCVGGVITFCVQFRKNIANACGLIRL